MKITAFLLNRVLALLFVSNYEKKSFIMVRRARPNRFVCDLRHRQLYT
jgi:hypothetical protein